jgi:hypothetical protein
MIRVELKYCECCGGLLLRPAAAPIIYCAPCARRLRELPQARMEKRSSRETPGRLAPALTGNVAPNDAKPGVVEQEAEHELPAAEQERTPEPAVASADANLTGPSFLPCMRACSAGAASPAGERRSA